VVFGRDHRFDFQLDDTSARSFGPRLAHMPFGPRSLEGLAHLRARSRVVSLRRLLSVPRRGMTPRG
jgi:hypothetical protein